VQDALDFLAAGSASGFDVFGLGITGNATLLASIDATNIAAGTYRFDGTTAGTYPTGIAAADTGLIETWRQASGTAMMMLYHATSDRVFHRRLATTWGAWREVITSNQPLARGDLIRRGATALERLALGTTGHVLQSDGTDTITGPVPWLYTSAQQTVTSATLLTLAHGLPAKPSEVQVSLLCTTADSPYLVGEEIVVTPNQQSTNTVGAICSWDATNIRIRTGNSGFNYWDNSGTVLSLTLSRWRYIARAR
jgi:hypothetical protein